jgi:hypothetical protein
MTSDVFVVVDGLLLLRYERCSVLCDLYLHITLTSLRYYQLCHKQQDILLSIAIIILC